MKVFEDSDRVNFVDDRNVVVGYDLLTCCCEHASWFVANQLVNTIQDQPGDFDLSKYRFDAKFLEEVDNPKEFEQGRMVVFRLIGRRLPDLYLHLFNCQNGYYSHGFEMKSSDTVVWEGQL